MKLQGVLQSQAPNFCQYVREVHVFRMDAWSDVKPLVSPSLLTGAASD
jgi:hypothetical protein